MEKKKHQAPAPARRWVKFYCAESLRGSIRLEEPDVRSVWYDLLLMAGDSREDGIVCATKGIPYPHKRIASSLGIRLALLELCLKKFIDQGRISEDGNGIHILKWTLYQAPYQMRLGLPEETKEPEPPEELTPEQLQQQAEIDAQYLDILKDKVAKGIEDSHTQPYPDRIAAAEKWQAEHPET